MTEYISAARAGEPKRQPARLRLELSPAEQVAVVGALRRDLELPDVDHGTIRDLLLRLMSWRS